MALVQTVDPKLLRDTDTMALIAANYEDLRRHRAKRRSVKKMIEHQQTVDDKFKLLDARLDKCEYLLGELVRHISTLVTKSTQTDTE